MAGTVVSAGMLWESTELLRLVHGWKADLSPPACRVVRAGLDELVAGINGNASLHQAAGHIRILDLHRRRRRHLLANCHIIYICRDIYIYSFFFATSAPRSKADTPPDASRAADTPAPPRAASPRVVRARRTNARRRRDARHRPPPRCPPRRMGLWPYDCTQARLSLLRRAQHACSTAKPCWRRRWPASALSRGTCAWSPWRCRWWLRWPACPAPSR